MIDKLIICNPYEKPDQYWKYNELLKDFEKLPGRRPSKLNKYGIIDQIRDKVESWKLNNYPGITSITRELLDYWNNIDHRKNQFFFCQMEAIETLIWLNEVYDIGKDKIKIPSDGSNFQRLCSKMATGTGKTVVMAMLIAYHIINKITYPDDSRFSSNFLIVTPGLTVKSRLDVLLPNKDDNYYDEFEILPDSLHDYLHYGTIMINNWHKLQPENGDKGVVKKGIESNSAMARRILKHNHNNIIVINDEAHHAYRSTDNDTVWIKGLDMIHNTRNILTCYDFSATPFTVSKGNIQDMFKWIISDFSLNDAIESGLTKTPTISHKDNNTDWSKYYHIYEDDDVKNKLNKNQDVNAQLPKLVISAYKTLGTHYKSILENQWNDNIPPVMISICNITKTAERVKNHFINDLFQLPLLSDKQNILHIDSKILKSAEEKDVSGTKSEDILRDTMNTVGKQNERGEQIRNVITVEMLSEGWDAHNVTHIIGLRAFTSELLCEQIIGRGLRRMSYEIDKDTGLLSPEYVFVMGVPFKYLPHEIQESNYKPQKLSVRVFSDDNRKKYEISWPNVEKINGVICNKLTIDWSTVKPLELIYEDTVTSVDFVPIIDGEPFLRDITKVQLDKLNNWREQTIIFKVAERVLGKLNADYKWFNSINDMYQFSQIISLVKQFINKKIHIVRLDKIPDEHRRLIIWFNMESVIKHVCDNIKHNNISNRYLVLNHIKPIKSTSDMRPTGTRKNTVSTKKSHLSHAICDSTWEETISKMLDKHKNVISWFKNHRGGFTISYLFDERVLQYIPDFIIKLNNVNVILEVKPTRELQNIQNKLKLKSLDEWINCVNDDGKYGKWKLLIMNDNYTKLQHILDTCEIPKTKCIDCKKEYRNCNCKCN